MHASKEGISRFVSLRSAKNVLPTYCRVFIYKEKVVYRNFTALFRFQHPHHELIPITYEGVLFGPDHQKFDPNSKKAQRSTSKLGDF